MPTALPMFGWRLQHDETVILECSLNPNLNPKSLQSGRRTGSGDARPGHGGVAHAADLHFQKLITNNFTAGCA